MLVLPEAWLRRWKGEDPFDRLMALEGEVYKLKTDHRTVRFTFEGKSYFAKLHRGAGWKEILGQLLKLRRPVLGAQTEWRAIQRLERLGIPTTPLVGYGKRGWHPARLESFVITEELTERVSLEDLGREWQASPPRPAFRRAVIGEVARIARVLHENGLNHRDFYLCHFLIRRPAKENRLDPDTRRASGLLHLIDLHRVQVRRRTPRTVAGQGPGRSLLLGRRPATPPLRHFSIHVRIPAEAAAGHPRGGHRVVETGGNPGPGVPERVSPQIRRLSLGFNRPPLQPVRAGKARRCRGRPGWGRPRIPGGRNAASSPARRQAPLPPSRP